MTNSATVAPAAGGVADPDNSNNTASVDTAVVPGADVRVDQKSVTSPPPGTPATAGQDVTFQIQPRNGGPAAAVNAVVTDVLPAGWVFVSASGPNWVCSNAGQTVSCTRANFPAGATDNLAIVATAPSGRGHCRRRHHLHQTAPASPAAHPTRTAATTAARSMWWCARMAPTCA